MGKRLKSIVLICVLAVGLAAGTASCGKGRDAEDLTDPTKYIFSMPPDKLDVWGVVEETGEKGEIVLTVEKLELTQYYYVEEKPLSFSEGDTVTLELASEYESLSAGQVVHVCFTVFGDITLEALNGWGGSLLETWDSLEAYNRDLE